MLRCLRATGISSAGAAGGLTLVNAANILLGGYPPAPGARPSHTRYLLAVLTTAQGPLTANRERQRIAASQIDPAAGLDAGPLQSAGGVATSIGPRRC